MKKVILYFVFLISCNFLSAQFYSYVWVHPYGSSEAMVMSEYEFPFDRFRIKFDQKGEITDSSRYPPHQKYYVAEVISIDTVKNISASLVGLFNLCAECDYFIVYKKTSEDYQTAYFVWDQSWSFDGTHDYAIEEFKKRLKKKVYKKKGFFDELESKFVIGNIYGNKIYFRDR